jgi:hypothetical protein
VPALRRREDRFRVIPLAALLALSAGALAFDVTLPLRLPSDGDYAEAAAALRTRAGPADAVQVWPPWAERARIFVEQPPVRAEENLRSADFPGVEKLWLLALPHVPGGNLAQAREVLRARAATPGVELRFGALSLQPWELHGPPVSWLTPPDEEHEVDYVARQCFLVRIGPPLAAGTFSARGRGGVVHVRAGVVGERAYQTFRAPVRVEVKLDGAPLGELAVPVTVPPEPGWRRLDLAAPAGVHDFAFQISSDDTDRPFCLSAWTTER